MGHEGDGVGVEQKIALLFSHLGKVTQECKVLRQVLAVRTNTIVNLNNTYMYTQLGVHGIPYVGFPWEWEEIYYF